MLDVEHILRKK